MRTAVFVLAVVAVVGVVATPVGPVMLIDGPEALGVEDVKMGNVSAEGVNDALDNASESIEDDGVNETKIRMEVHYRVNEIRTERGLRPLEYSNNTAAQAENHSEWMAETSQYQHSGRGYYLCQDRYGENIMYTYVSQDIETESGTVNYYGNETDIAHGIVRSWMNSEPHRENILRQVWYSEGIGIAIADTEDGERVYATQGFCGV